METYRVVCAAGTLQHPDGAAVRFPHRWTEAGVALTAQFTGAHLLHASIAGCVLNDLYREASALGVQLDGVRVSAWGGFDQDWHSTGIEYQVELAAAGTDSERLLAVVDAVAEIPRAVRAGAPVSRVV